MTVVARRRLSWRGARRSLRFVLGLALFAIAAIGPNPPAQQSGHTGTDRTAVATAAEATPTRPAGATAGSPAVRSRTVPADAAHAGDRAATATLGTPTSAPVEPALLTVPDPASAALDSAFAPAAGPRAPPLRTT